MSTGEGFSGRNGAFEVTGEAVWQPRPILQQMHIMIDPYVFYTEKNATYCKKILRSIGAAAPTGPPL